MALSNLSFQDYFAKIKDPRRSHRRLHSLVDIIVIAVCGVISGCDTWQDIETFAVNRQTWLKRFLRLPNGIPAHDTFERVFARLHSGTLERCILQWLYDVKESLDLRHIAIDGKSVRGSRRPSSELRALHLVSAWATQAHLSLGQVAVDRKSNEITAIPKLLELLKLKGALITIDAMGCQKEIAKQIVTGGGDFALAVKNNQERLYHDIEETFLEAFETNYKGFDCQEYKTEEQKHGRKETRWYTILYNAEDRLRDREAWPSVKVLGSCCRERTLHGKTTGEVHYFIGSRRLPAKRYAQVLRGHWGIENNLHWQLDVTFREDDSRIAQRNAAANFNLLRRTALSLLKQHPSKNSIRRKRLTATLDTDFLEDVLRGARNLGDV